MDAFDRAEMIGREKFKKDIQEGCLYEFTSSKFDPIDCFITGNNGETYAVEIKDRNCVMATYAKDGYVLEMAKYRALMDAYEKSGYTPTYRNYFHDGKLTWMLQDIDITDRIEERLFLKTTADGCNDYREKDVIFLKKDESVEEICLHNKKNDIKC